MKDLFRGELFTRYLEEEEPRNYNVKRSYLRRFFDILKERGGNLEICFSIRRESLFAYLAWISNFKPNL